jgi:hypothetical protein
MMSITEQSRSRIKSHADSLLIELESILTPGQMERAKKVLRRRPPHFRDRKEREEGKYIQ